MNKFDSIVTGAFDIANSKALSNKNTQIYPEHLLIGLINNPSSYISRALKEYKKEIIHKINELPISKNSVGLENLRASPQLSEWITYASSNAVSAGRDEITEKDLLKYLPKICSYLDIDYTKFSDEEMQEEDVPKFLINLNELADNGKLDPVIGRASEIRAVMEILGRRSKNNPVLVGPAGVGKTAIVEGLARKIVNGEVPDVLKDKIVYSLEMGLLMAGTKYQGEFEERLTGLIDFLKEKAGECILFIDEIHQLVGAGKNHGAMDAANLLKPALARGELNCIGATTNEEYQKYILGDSALDRRFRNVPVNEPSKEDTIEILMGLKEKFEIHHGIQISEDAIYNAVYLSEQYITDKNLPDKAIDLVDEACSSLKLSAEAMPSKLVVMQAEIRSKKILAQVEKRNKEILNEIKLLELDFSKEHSLWEKEVLSVKHVSELKKQLDSYKIGLEQKERAGDYELASKLKYSLIPEVEDKLSSLAHDWVLTTKDIALVISRDKGIPVEKILKSKQEEILELEVFLQNKVFGQDKVLHEISQTLLAAHAGLSDPSRPLGSFLLKGPSGVGKTQTAKALTEFLFNNENNIIRLDMSEFSEKHSVAKLIGAPAGYIGYEEGGILTEAVRTKPYSIILFDEIEKAHFDFTDILLQILDDGRLTDNKGRSISFLNTVIFLTTNSTNLERDFKPELLGRLDSICEYKPLEPLVMNKLVTEQLSFLNQRLFSKDIKISLSDELINKLSQLGFNEAYGARPLAQVFNKLVIRPLSQKILKGEIISKEVQLDWNKCTELVEIK